MSNVEFEDGSFTAERFNVPSVGVPVSVRFLLKIGLVKDENQANYVLIGISVCALALAVWVFKDAMASPRPAPSQNVIPISRSVVYPAGR